MLLKKQNPWLPCGSLAEVTVPSGPAWWPGGLMAQNAFRACRVTKLDELSGRVQVWDVCQAGMQQLGEPSQVINACSFPLSAALGEQAHPSLCT